MDLAVWIKRFWFDWYGFFLQTFVVNGEKNTPKFNKEYLWNHSTELDHVKTIRHEIYSTFYNLKKVSKQIYIYVYFFKIETNSI